MPGFLICHHLLEFAQVHGHCIGDAIQPSHSLCPPQTSPLSPSPVIRSPHHLTFDPVNPPFSVPVPGVCSGTTRETPELGRNRGRRGLTLPGAREGDVSFSPTPGHHPWRGPLGNLPFTWIPQGNMWSSQAQRHTGIEHHQQKSGHTGVGLTHGLTHMLHACSVTSVVSDSL